jgi:predicted DNA-binding transcriptional regulator AlpA
LTQEVVLKFTAEDSKSFLALLEEVKQLLKQSKVTSVESNQQELPLKRGEVLRELNLKESTFYKMQNRGIITPHRLDGSRLTFYYRSEVLSALKKFNPGKYAR